VERASRLIVIVSLALAGLTHAWLVNWPGVAAAAGVAFAAMFLLARFSLTSAVAVAMFFTFLAPALLARAFGSQDYQLTIIWLAALCGPLLAHADLSRWSVPPRWRAPLAAWAAIVALGWPIVAAREADFSVLALRATQTTNPMLEATPRLAATFVVIFAMTQLIGIVWVDFLWATFRDRRSAAGRAVIVPLIAGAVICSAVGVYQQAVDLSWMNAHIWANVHRAGGLMLDANAFGTGTAMLAPASVALAWSTRSSLPLAFAAYAVLALGMWTAGSRTAFLVFCFGSAALVIAALRHRGLWQPRIGRLVALLGVAVFLLAAALVPRDFTSSNPLERAFARVPPFEGSEIRRFATELWVRFGYGRAADAMVLEHPISGVGVGSFHLIAPEYIYRDTGRIIPPDNAQNWWRHQVAELGVVGAIPALWMTFLVATLCRGRDDSSEEKAATPLRGVLIGLAGVSLVGVPTQSPAVTIVFGALLFWLATAAKPRDEMRPTIPRTWHLLALLVAVVIASVALSARGTLRVPYRAMRAGVPYAYGLTAPQEVSPYGEVRWMATHALWVLPAKDRWLRLTVWAPHGDLASRPVRFDIQVNADATRSRTLLDERPSSIYIDTTRARALMLELNATRELTTGRALQIATSWHADLPRDVPEEYVIR
jgi:hypothetical protein